MATRKPGPAKRFDPDEVLVRARDLFWRRGYAATGVRELETELGVGRKSLYDTYGDKRALYLQALEQYTDSVIERICHGLRDARNTPLQNLERVLGRLAAHHGSPDSLGCLLGVAMAQADPRDEELAAQLRRSLKRLERAFTRTLEQAQAAGEIRPEVRCLDAARQLVALTQGMALMGRVLDGPASTKSMARAALAALQV
ncbi:MAG: TetR family transcriptional regulator [Planctomycetes bacterium]|nr:TetR family transcriptional regulator [Planctomycetota bacterium]